MIVRISSFELYTPCVTDNYNSRGVTDHKRHRAFLVPGGSGIGKSRAGYELRHLADHAKHFNVPFNVKARELDAFEKALGDACYLYINLNNGCAYDKSVDEKYSGSVRIGARLAVAAGLSAERLSDMMTDYDVR